MSKVTSALAYLLHASYGEAVDIPRGNTWRMAVADAQREHDKLRAEVERLRTAMQVVIDAPAREMAIRVIEMLGDASPSAPSESVTTEEKNNGSEEEVEEKYAEGVQADDSRGRDLRGAGISVDVGAEGDRRSTSRLDHGKRLGAVVPQRTSEAILPVAEGWEPWTPSAASAGICVCLAAHPFAEIFRKEDQLRCSRCVPRTTTATSEASPDSEAAALENHKWWTALALVHGWNEMAKMASVLEEKTYCRMGRDAAEKHFAELGGEIRRTDDEVTLLVLPNVGPPGVSFRESDIELMRSTVAAHDAKAKPLPLATTEVGPDPERIATLRRRADANPSPKVGDFVRVRNGGGRGRVVRGPCYFVQSDQGGPSQAEDADTLALLSAPRPATPSKSVAEECGETYQGRGDDDASVCTLPKGHAPEWEHEQRCKGGEVIASWTAPRPATPSKPTEACTCPWGEISPRCSTHGEAPTEAKSDDFERLTWKLARARGMLISARGVIGGSLPQGDCTPEEITEILEETKGDPVPAASTETGLWTNLEIALRLSRNGRAELREIEGELTALRALRDYLNEAFCVVGWEPLNERWSRYEHEHPTAPTLMVADAFPAKLNALLSAATPSLSSIDPAFVKAAAAPFVPRPEIGDVVVHAARQIRARVLSIGSHEAHVSLEPAQVNEPGEQYWPLTSLVVVEAAPKKVFDDGEDAP